MAPRYVHETSSDKGLTVPPALSHISLSLCPAASALLAFLSRVCANVPFVIGVVAESAAALVAAVRLFTRVNPQVFLITVEPRQSLPADVTRVRLVDFGLDLAVHLYVFGPVAALSERSAANGANVRVHHLGQRRLQFHTVKLAVTWSWIRICSFRGILVRAGLLD